MKRVDRIAGWAVMAAAVAGCRTAEQVEQDRSASASFPGTHDGGLQQRDWPDAPDLPGDHLRARVRRDGPPVVSSYGGYSKVTACRLLIQTKPTGTADAWTIGETTLTGPCGLLPI
ncbi:hypothetical protein [Aureimonas sp. SK2]|uniref:hypothetical protein n=1 Tax=Aureimonas sp. SK2 TaxID=3015992 RepID=UPI002443802E|nr:hypothetical protein [Aureimonas sp. SK2]